MTGSHTAAGLRSTLARFGPSIPISWRGSEGALDEARGQSGDDDLVRDPRDTSGQRHRNQIRSDTFPQHLENAGRVVIAQRRESSLRALQDPDVVEARRNLFSLAR